MFLNYIFGNKSNINEKILAANKITIINKNELKIDKAKIIAITGSGKFVPGIYKNEHVSVKIVDISKEEMILNEFIYWQEFKGNSSFLEFKGVSLQGNEAFLVFEYFGFTLDKCLMNKMLKEDNKINFAQQIGKILQSLQDHKKIHKDFRPGVLGITDKFKVKLLDFGYLICGEPINKEYVERVRYKYIPPEGLQYDLEDLSYDIWSFGCILIDIFSDIEPIYKINATVIEVYNLHNLGIFPTIPSDIKGLIKDLIVKCLERNYEKRIHMKELIQNLEIFTENSLHSDKIEQSEKLDTHNWKNLSNHTKKELEDISEFIEQTEEQMNHMNEVIVENLMEDAKKMKNTLEHSHNDTLKRLSDNYLAIRENLSDISVSKIEIMDKIKEKSLENFLQLQQYYGNAFSEIVEAQNIISEMKVNMNSLKKLTNPEKYTNLIDSLEKNKVTLEKHFELYSNEKEYDLIINENERNKDILNAILEFKENEELLMNDILDVIRKHNENFIKKSKIKQLFEKLGIEHKLLNNISETLVIKDIYAKVQENSNIIIIYDIEKKKFHQIRFEEKSAFESKCYSFFKNSEIFVSGGLSTIDKKTPMNTFYKIKVKIILDYFEFELEELPPMNYSRYSHTFIEYNDIYFVFGGYNTQTCEIFYKDNWIEIPQLPILLPNAAAAVINNEYVLLFGGKAKANSIEGIYKLSIRNLAKILENVKGFENVLEWEPIPYYFNDAVSLKRGMGIFHSTLTNSVLLVGGFDIDNIFDWILNFPLDSSTKAKRIVRDEENIPDNKSTAIDDSNINQIESFKLDIDENKFEDDSDYHEIEKMDTMLPLKTFFNSNIVAYNSYVVMIDGFNNAIEFDLKTKQFNYYT